MPFSAGDSVVHPHHGAAIVEDIEKRTIKGVEHTYLVLRILAQDSLIVRVPASKIETVGVRDVMGDEGLAQLKEVLQKVDVEEPSNWSRRFKANSEKLNSGDVYKVAEVVRDLTRRSGDKGLSAGEKGLLSQGRQIIVSELALAKEVDEDEAQIQLDKILGLWKDED